VTLLWLKLAFAGLSRRRLQAGLTVTVVAAAAAALTLALAIGAVAGRPWERTFAATRGAHVTAFSLSGGRDLTVVERQPGVVASTGERPTAFTSFRHDGGRFGLRLVGVHGRPPALDRPLLVAGRWPRDGEVLLERSFARVLGLAAGDALVAGNGIRLRVAGISVVTQGEPYPLAQPGLGFVRVETLARVAPVRARWSHVVGVRLADPDGAAPFAARLQTLLGPGVHVETWTDTRAEATAASKTSRVVLASFSVLLLLAAGFVLATLIGGRVLAQVRELALLKAAGLTPGEVVRVFVFEQLALGAVGTVIGIAAGTLTAPLFVTRSASLLGASEIPAFDPLRALGITAVVLAAVTLATLLPTWRAGSRTTASSLAAGVSSPGTSRPRFTHLADRLGLPIPLTLGAADAFANRGRAVVTALCLALTVGSIVATLGLEASLDVGVGAPIGDPIAYHGDAERLRAVVYGLDAVLLCVGIANIVATLLLGVRERVRDLALLKAVGLAPRQVASVFLSAQAVVASLGALAGIPIGFALFRTVIAANGSTDAFAYPTWWWLGLLVPVTVALVLVVSAPLARQAASLRIVDALRYE
jgi:putative ABC transport system permease protein